MGARGLMGDYQIATHADDTAKLMFHR